MGANTTTNPFTWYITTASQEATTVPTPTPTTKNLAPTGFTTTTPKVTQITKGVTTFPNNSNLTTAYLSINTAASSTDPTLKNFKGNTLSFPFNPNDLMFNYVLNKMSFDTFGGRVTQLLSVKIDQMTLQVDAGSRANLLAFYNGIKTLQAYQIQTSTVIEFTIPAPPLNQSTGQETGEYIPMSKLILGTGLTFYVWIKSMDIGWDPTTVTYPFSITFEVQDSSYSDFNGNGYSTVTELIGNLSSIFDVTKGGIGYNELFVGMPPVGKPTGNAASTFAIQDINQNGTINPSTLTTNFNSGNAYG